ncbi:hypothetical protein IFM89_017618 [Coptis chinensis]|uniref:Uncharacterized protein n=1 Tax=Coptis chinensis TaxID=261450 RepID=A0A835LEJ9_9MAGN|nr:hypothetical protein IFM89_017618 [Coptis chinensis]
MCFSTLWEVLFVVSSSEESLKKKKKIASPSWAGFCEFITALSRGTRVEARRGTECLEGCPKFLISSPTFHGGRGALPSAGGHPADLTFLAGGGC